MGGGRRLAALAPPRREPPAAIQRLGGPFSTVGTGPAASALLELQRTAGNEATAALVGSVQRKAVRPYIASEASIVSNAIDRGAYIALERPPQEGFGPPAPGGAFFYLNGLNPADLVETLRALDAKKRSALEAHLADADGHYDRPRLAAALRTAKEGGTGASLDVLDSIRNGLRSGNLGPAFKRLGALGSRERRTVLKRFDLATLQSLLDHVEEAPTLQQPSFEGLIADLIAGPASNVLLDFIPDESTVMADGRELPMGAIHVYVKGKEQPMSPIQARGGPWKSAKEGKHTLDPSKPGTYTLGEGKAVVTAWWKFSQLAQGTPIREVARPDGVLAVEYQTGNGTWRDTKRLAQPITREGIVYVEKVIAWRSANPDKPKSAMTEEELAKQSGNIPNAWNLNDFSKEGFHVGDSDMYLHPTQVNEYDHALGLPEKLTFSHGCIHITVKDRQALIAAGYLRKGVRITIHAYADPDRWGPLPE